MQAGVMGRAQWRNRDLPNSQAPSLFCQMRPQVDASLGTLRSVPTQSMDDLRTNFITSTANTYTTMYYKIRYRGFRDLGQGLGSDPEYPAGGAPPPGMDEGDAPGLGVGQIHGDAVRHADGQEDAWQGRGVPVPPLRDEPAIRNRLVPANQNSMDLARKDHRGQLRAEMGLKGAPPVDGRPYRCVAGELEREAVLRGRDPRDETVAGGPLRELESGNPIQRAGRRGLAEHRRPHSTRRISAPRPRRRSSMRS